MKTTHSGAAVIVGASVAGITVAHELRALGWSADLIVIDEQLPVFARPPLSKSVLDPRSPEPAPLAVELSTLGIQTMQGRAVALDVDRRSVALNSGAEMSYGVLVIATGARARRIGVPQQLGELVLRDVVDALELRRRLPMCQSVVVVGAGFLGLEVASAARAVGASVTVVDVEPPLKRILGSYLSQMVSDYLNKNDIVVRLMQQPVQLKESPVNGVAAGTQIINADLVVTCAGDVPNVEWLMGTEIYHSAGVLIEPTGHTGIPNVLAAGDVTRQAFGSGWIRKPFWSNAVAQGCAVACGVTGIAAPNQAGDYFFTDILGRPLRAVGQLPAVGEPQVVEGSLEKGKALLQWRAAGASTTVAWGLRTPAARLRAINAG